MNAPAYKKLLARKATKKNMQLAQVAVADPTDELPSEGLLWKSTKHKDVSRSIRCDAPGQREVWKLASELWKLKTGADLAKPATGQTMACAAIKRGDVGTTRLFRILVSESAFLIWRLRCEGVIQEKTLASEREIHNIWLKTLHNRLGMDQAMTNDEKYGKKAIGKLLVLQT
ncbi:hypothetical protein B0H17DRAFT_1129910 [Mycena rosella]|uniref:Uncharacterized protein n=1 Tax=Mycena rosella TaxID=1033263 RepID=A0AAD7DUX2_MYCRO|nr:hypothetical protein B0H17DRAFT_1129910 [Mycena rosella]